MMCNADGSPNWILIADGSEKGTHSLRIRKMVLTLEKGRKLLIHIGKQGNQKRSLQGQKQTQQATGFCENGHFLLTCKKVVILQ